MNRSEILLALKARRWSLLFAVLLVVAFGYWVSPKLLGRKVQTLTVSKGALLQTVVASGKVEAPARIDIGSQITGAVAAIPVAEGQAVKAGQTLILLENADQEAAVDQARAAADQAQARLRQIHELSQPVAQQALAQARATLFNVKKQYDRTEQLVEKGFVGKAQLDDAKRSLEVAESQVKTAQLQVQANQADGSDYALAQTGLQQARASSRAAEARLRHTVIAAPSDGTLITRDVERGNIVQPGKALMVLSPSGKTQLVLQIDEKNLRFLAPGQNALAAADAYPDQKFKARVAYINPGIDAQRGSVEVKLDVPAPPAYLRQDMTVSVDIEVARRADALTLPPDAIHDAASAAPWVMAVSAGKARKKLLRLGVRGERQIEILSGVQEGEQILPAAGAALPEGTRIRSSASAPKGPD
jgi:HlyD family secretion protein